MIRVRQVKVDIDKKNIDEIILKTAKKLKIKKDNIHDIKILKEAIDARKKDDIKYVYEVIVDIPKEDTILKTIKSNDVEKHTQKDYEFNITGLEKLNAPITVVGSGPAGLFLAYMLSIHGYKVVVIERGEPIKERIQRVEEFWQTGKLNTNSNVQFGEGGAGTFSDGKLNTLVKDKENRCHEVYKIFVEHGANEDILYASKPHIGTDVLRNVVQNMRNKIISLGGVFKYNTTLTDVIIENGNLMGIIINDNEEIKTDNLVLALGHSARDTFKMLLDRGINLEAKPFAVGVRIMHPQNMINESQYGYNKNLPNASYKLTYLAKSNRGVYSFCMCPGGYVVNASSELNGVVVNGMSYRDRNSGVANSAIVVTVNPNDFGNNPLDGVEFQKRLEERAYIVGEGKIPVQLYKDFKQGKETSKYDEFLPKLKGAERFVNLKEMLPKFISNDLEEAIEYFGTKIKGFNSDFAILAGVESRTSSPVKIVRDDNFMTNINGIYAIGEGSGYAGGITTSAIDGIKMAEIFAKKYKNN